MLASSNVKAMQRIIYTTIALLLCFYSTTVVAQTQAANTQLEVLLLNATTYDVLYTQQIASFLQKNPGVSLSSDQGIRANEIATQLEGKDIAIIAYPHKGSLDLFQIYGQELRLFTERGGIVVFTGTHEISKINLFRLLQFEKGSYNPVPQVEIERASIFTKNLPAKFSSSNFTYPVEISNEGYVSLAKDEERSVFGFIRLGQGHVFYVGLEFYHLEQVNKDILNNLLSFARKQQAQHLITTKGNNPAPEARSIETIENKAIDWEIFPNPFVSDTKVQFTVQQQSLVEVSIFDVTGKLIQNPISNNTFDTGKYSLDITTLPYGVFFVQINIGSQKSVKKIMKVQAP
jgi:hypothetical protein